MTYLLGAPLVPAAVVSALVALLSIGVPLVALVLGALIAIVGAGLAMVSAGTPRRVLWAATATAAAAAAARTFVPVPYIEIAVVGALVNVRAALAAPLSALVPEPESAILLGIVLGERAGIAPDLRDAFAATGTAHLLAISGFNMTLVAGAVAIGLRGRAHPALIALAGTLAVLGYSALVGPAPSVGRAALMAAVAAVALALGRRGAAGNALAGAAALMLILDPSALEDVGFLLSVAATAGMVVGQAPLAERFARLPSPVAEGLAATLAASLPTIPLVAAVFGRISLVAPLANLIAVPLFAPILLFGAATAALGALVPWAAGPLALVAYVFTAALRITVEVLAAIPLASVEVPAGPPAALLCVAAIAAGAWAIPRLIDYVRGIRVPTLSARPAMPNVQVPRPGRITAVALCVLVAVAAFAAVVGAPREAGLRLRALDVGQGDAFLLESAGRYALIDGGPDPRRLLRELGRALAPWERRIDLVVLTHEHADHGNGLLSVLERYDVGLALEPAGMKSDEPLTKLWAERAERARVRRVPLTAGARVRFGNATLHVLAPIRDRQVAIPNLVFLAEAPEGRVLFMADATDDLIADLLLSPDDLAAHVYVPPHHGADTAHAAALLEAVSPQAALISVGAGNRYGHPTPATLEALSSVPVYRTDRHGTVEVELDGDGIRIHADKAGVPPDRGGSVPRASPSR